MQAILGTAGTSKGQQACHMTDSPVKITVSVNVLDGRVQFTIVSRHAVRAYGEGEVQLHSYVSAALDRGGQLHVAAALILETLTCYPLRRRLDGLKKESDVSEKRKLFLLPGIDPRYLSCQARIIGTTRTTQFLFSVVCISYFKFYKTIILEMWQ